MTLVNLLLAKYADIEQKVPVRDEGWVMAQRMEILPPSHSDG